MSNRQEAASSMLRDVSQISNERASRREENAHREVSLDSWLDNLHHSFVFDLFDGQMRESARETDPGEGLAEDAATDGL